jgi:hypothetical protein
MRQIAAPFAISGTAISGFSRYIQEYIDTLQTNDNNSHCDLSSKKAGCASRVHVSSVKVCLPDKSRACPVYFIPGILVKWLAGTSRYGGLEVLVSGEHEHKRGR